VGGNVGRAALEGEGVSAWRLLARAEWTQHRGRYGALVVVLGSGVAGLFLVLALLSGLEAAVADELSATVAGDGRIARASTDFARGEMVPIASAQAAFGDAARPRLEAQVLWTRGEDHRNWSAGLAVGLDRLDRRLASRIVEGALFESDWTQVDGIDVAPVVLGQSAARDRGVAVGDVVNLTAGRTETVGGELRPIVRPARVVGLYSTGLPVVDLYAVFLPIERARTLVGEHPGRPVANVFVVDGEGGERALAAAGATGWSARSLPEFEAYYLGPLFGSLRAVALLLATIAVAAILAWSAHALTMLVLQDAHKIATLAAVGVSFATVRNAYLAAGAAVGVSGAAVGILAGGLVVLLASVVPVLPGLGGLPLRLQAAWTDALLLAALSVSVALAAARIALSYARRQDPLDALRAG